MDIQWTDGFGIGRKSLVRKGGAFKRTVFSSNRVQQEYIPCLNMTMRVHVRDDETYLAVERKSTHGGVTRYEFKAKITFGETSHLLQLCQGGIIDERRYLVKSGNHIFEVGEFYGNNGGLVMTEVELKSESEPYEKPDSIGPEITGDAHFHNKYMLTNPFSTWKDMLPGEYR